MHTIIHESGWRAWRITCVLSWAQPEGPSINLSAFDERKEQMGIRRPTKRVGVCAFAAIRYLLTLLRGQSRQVHVPVPGSTSTSSESDSDSVCSWMVHVPLGTVANLSRTTKDLPKPSTG